MLYKAPAYAGAFLFYVALVMMHIRQDIFIKEVCGKGNAVFTNTPVSINEIIEISPVIVMTAEERKALDKTLLHDYIFSWEPDGTNMCCMAQGYISVYNHSDAANCEYYMDYEKETITVKAVRNIAANEELTVNYNGDWNNTKPVWFDTV